MADKIERSEMPRGITSIAELKKWAEYRIKEIDDTAVDDRRQPTIEEYDIIAVYNVVLEKINELEAHIKKEIEALETIPAESVRHIRAYELYRLLTGDSIFQEFAKFVGDDKSGT